MKHHCAVKSTAYIEVSITFEYGSFCQRPNLVFGKMVVGIVSVGKKGFGKIFGYRSGSRTK